MVVFLFLHDFFVLGLSKGVVVAEEVTKDFLAPVPERATMMLILFRVRACNYSPAHFGSFGLFLADKSIGVLDVVHVALEF